MKRRQPLSFDLTPLIDVVFILLIFFIVTSTFRKDEHKLAVRLPSSEYGESVNVKEEINIELSESGVALNGKVLTLDEIDNELAKVKNNKTPVFSRIDRDVRYEKIVALFDLLKKHRLENIVLVAKKKK
ncbi:MAG: biopolymer transporter ExbD [Proteobacteria bacterium]|nr:biopolymer transporter ExbD [Pseudomonadota bacterium]